MTIMAPAAPLTAADYASDQEVRWCPGCGDYAILKGVRKALADLLADPASTVFVSGIGCAARFPYYMATYGFHTIHGRAPAIATGIKLANPALDVWVISGDGDSLSIGGNHLMHVLRRNVDLQYLMFNNQIYGLTKGQYSPTSHVGTRSPSTPGGSLDRPVSAVGFALGCGARFVARTIDTRQDHLPEMMKRAHGHRGTAFVEILQNCIVYNDGVFDPIAGKAVAADRTVAVEHGRPLLFGKDRDRGLRLKPGSLSLEVVTLGNGIGVADLLVHDETDRMLATVLAGLEPPQFPTAIGVLYCDPAPAYDRLVADRMAAGTPQRGADALNRMLRRGHTWTVGPAQGSREPVAT